MNFFVKSFVSGFLSTLLFHQSLLGALYLLKLTSIAPYRLHPVSPFGVPSVLSLSFFGGLWGILILWSAQYDTGFWFWVKCIVYGSVGPTAVAVLLIFPLKGIDLGPTLIVGGLLLNAVWGLGCGILKINIH